MPSLPTSITSMPARRTDFPLGGRPLNEPVFVPIMVHSPSTDRSSRRRTAPISKPRSGNAAHSPPIWPRSASPPIGPGVVGSR